jgi:hypothetical protein
MHDEDAALGNPRQIRGPNTVARTLEHSILKGASSKVHDIVFVAGAGGFPGAIWCVFKYQCAERGLRMCCWGPVSMPTMQKMEDYLDDEGH